MLVLNRKPGESIQIGDNVRLTVLRIEGRKVTIGIEAPRNVVVDREEIHERKRREAAQVEAGEAHAAG